MALVEQDYSLTMEQENWLFLWDRDCLAEHEDLFAEIAARFEANPALHEIPRSPDPFEATTHTPLPKATTHTPLPKGTSKPKLKKKGTASKQLAKRPAAKASTLNSYKFCGPFLSKSASIISDCVLCSDHSIPFLGQQYSSANSHGMSF